MPLTLNNDRHIMKLFHITIKAHDEYLVTNNFEEIAKTLN